MKLYLLPGKCRGNARLGCAFLRRTNRENISETSEYFQDILDIIYSVKHQDYKRENNLREKQIYESLSKEELIIELIKEWKIIKEANERIKEEDERIKEADERIKELEASLRQLKK